MLRGPNGETTGPADRPDEALRALAAKRPRRRGGDAGGLLGGGDLCRDPVLDLRDVALEVVLGVLAPLSSARLRLVAGGVELGLAALELAAGALELGLAIGDLVALGGHPLDDVDRPVAQATDAPDDVGVLFLDPAQILVAVDEILEAVANRAPP